MSRTLVIGCHVPTPVAAEEVLDGGAESCPPARRRDEEKLHAPSQLWAPHLRLLLISWLEARGRRRTRGGTHSCPSNGSRGNVVCLSGGWSHAADSLHARTRPQVSPPRNHRRAQRLQLARCGRADETRMRFLSPKTRTQTHSGSGPLLWEAAVGRPSSCSSQIQSELLRFLDFHVHVAKAIDATC